MTFADNLINPAIPNSRTPVWRQAQKIGFDRQDFARQGNYLTRWLSSDGHPKQGSFQTPTASINLYCYRFLSPVINDGSLMSESNALYYFTIITNGVFLVVDTPSTYFIILTHCQNNCKQKIIITVFLLWLSHPHSQRTLHTGSSIARLPIHIK